MFLLVKSSWAIATMPTNSRQWVCRYRPWTLSNRLAFTKHPVKMEAELVEVTEIIEFVTGKAEGFVLAVEADVFRTHVEDGLRLSDPEIR